MNECMKLAYLCTNAFCSSVGARISRKMIMAPILQKICRGKIWVEIETKELTCVSIFGSWMELVGPGYYSQNLVNPNDDAWERMM